MATKKLLFKAKPGLPADKGGKRWLHEKAQIKKMPYAGGQTTKVLPPAYIADGEVFELDDKLADALLKHQPHLFSKAASSPKPKAPKAEPKVEPEAEPEPEPTESTGDKE